MRPAWSFKLVHSQLNWVRSSGLRVLSVITVILVSLKNDIKIIHIKRFSRYSKMLYKWSARQKQSLQRRDSKRWNKMGQWKNRLFVGYIECTRYRPLLERARYTSWLSGFRLAGELLLQYYLARWELTQKVVFARVSNLRIITNCRWTKLISG